MHCANSHCLARTPLLSCVAMEISIVPESFRTGTSRYYSIPFVQLNKIQLARGTGLYAFRLKRAAALSTSNERNFFVCIHKDITTYYMDITSFSLR